MATDGGDPPGSEPASSLDIARTASLAPTRPSARGALHDVSNVLTVLLGWVDEAAASLSNHDAAQAAHALAIIRERAELARDLARAGVGSSMPDEPARAEAVIEATVAALHIEARSRDVTLDLEILVDDAIVAEARALSHVVTNLVLNALAFAPPRSRVVARVAGDERTVTVDVEDQGPGVAVEDRPRLFEGVSRRPGGSGLGLRHSREVARAVGGDLSLLASAQGAHFRLVWPRRDAVPAPPRSIARAAELSAMSILVVEDDPAVVQLVTALLEARGAAITTASSVGAATQALVGADFDAVLLDLSPVLGEAARFLASVRAHCPDARVIVMSGQPDRLPESLAAPSISLVRKPFDMRELVAALTAPITPA